MFSCSSTICGSRCSSVHSSRCNRDTYQVTCCAPLISWLSSSHTLSHCPKAGRTCIIFLVGPPYACGAPQQWVSALKTALLPVKGSAHRTAGTCSHYNACFFCIQNWYATIFSPQHLSYMFSQPKQRALGLSRTPRSLAYLQPGILPPAQQPAAPTAVVSSL